MNDYKYYYYEDRKLNKNEFENAIIEYYTHSDYLFDEFLNYNSDMLATNISIPDEISDDEIASWMDYRYNGPDLRHDEIPKIKYIEIYKPAEVMTFFKRFVKDNYTRCLNTAIATFRVVLNKSEVVFVNDKTQLIVGFSNYEDNDYLDYVKQLIGDRNG